MFRRSLPLSLLLTITALVPGAAQTTDTSAPLTTVRDPQALSVIQQAVIALGGFAVPAQITDATVTGTIQPADGGHLKAGTFVWMDAPPEFRYEIRTVDATRVFASGHGFPANQVGARARPLLQHMATATLPFHLPALVLARELQDARYSVLLVGSVVVNGALAAHVRISLNTDSVSAAVTPQDWYFDSSSGLPIRVEHRLPDNHHANDCAVEAEDFSNFQTVKGLQVPFHMTIYEDGVLQGAATVGSVNFNTGLSSSEFDLAVGGAQ